MFAARMSSAERCAFPEVCRFSRPCPIQEERKFSCSPSLHSLLPPSQLYLLPPPLTPIAAAQELDVIDPCGHLIRAWVDPVFGVDGTGIHLPGSSLLFFAQVNDPDAPFKTIQYAVDAVEHESQ